MIKKESLGAYIKNKLAERTARQQARSETSWSNEPYYPPFEKMDSAEREIFLEEFADIKIQGVLLDIAKEFGVNLSPQVENNS